MKQGRLPGIVKAQEPNWNRQYEMIEWLRTVRLTAISRVCSAAPAGRGCHKLNRKYGQLHSVQCMFDDLVRQYVTVTEEEKNLHQFRIHMCAKCLALS